MEFSRLKVQDNKKLHSVTQKQILDQLFFYNQICSTRHKKFQLFLVWRIPSIRKLKGKGKNATSQEM